MHLEEATHHLSGPIMSLRTPFDRAGAIDFAAVRRIIDRGIDGGTRTVMLTVGDSHYDCLSDGEISELTRVTVSHTAGRAMVIAADRYHSTARAVALAACFRELGADMYMPLPPDWGQSCTPESMAQHYAAVAGELPVMIVTNRFITRGGAFGLETLERAFELSPGVLAIKDDMGGTFAHDICMRFNRRAAIVAGGQKRNHMNMHPYGCTGYLSTFAMFNPTFAQSYWSAIERRNLKEATQMIEKQDAPFFDTILKVRGGFDAAMHGMIELYGLGQRHRRKPYVTLTDEELADLRECLVRIDLI